MNEQELENEWIKKYDFSSGKLRDTLTQECYEWARKNEGRTNELIYLKKKERLNECYNEIILFLRSWIDMKEEYYHIVALWIIGTYFHKQFNTFPFLFFNAMKGSGKSRLLRIISYLQRGGNGDLLNNASESVVFRTAQQTGLIFDEFENIGKKEKQTLREILNATYKKGGKVKRMHKVFSKEGETQKVEEFVLFTPVAMANIWGLEEVLEDRCLTLILEKSINPCITKKIEDFEDNPKLNELKQKLNELSVVSVVSLQKINCREWNNYITFKYNINDTTTHTTYTTLTTQTTPNNTTTLQELEQLSFFNRIDHMEINGRMLELLFPLLLVSYLISEDNLVNTLSFAKNVVESKKSEELSESRDVIALNFLSRLDLSYESSLHSLLDIARSFKEFVGEMDDEDYNWANAKWLGRALKRLNLILDKRRMGKGREVRINVQKAKEKIKIFKEVEKEEVKPLTE